MVHSRYLTVIAPAAVTTAHTVISHIFGFDWDFEIETSLKEAYDIAVVTKVCVVRAH
jgi:hypothetical protein